MFEPAAMGIFVLYIKLNSFYFIEMAFKAHHSLIDSNNYGVACLPENNKSVVKAETAVHKMFLLLNGCKEYIVSKRLSK